jgi:Putative MetA-pathway of phenol degradation
MHPLSLFFCGIAAMVLLSENSYAGAWPRKQGTGFLQIGFSSIGYNKIYDDNGDKALVNADVRDNVLQAFGEVGVTDLLTISTSLPFKMLSVKPTDLALAPLSSKTTRSGIGDIDITARYNLFVEQGYAASVGLLFGIPSGDTKNMNGLILGDGEFNVAPRLLVGHSFHPIPAFISADFAYNFRGSGFSNEFLYSLEFGYGLMENSLYVILLLSGKESTSSVPSAATAPSAFGLSTNNQEYTAIVPKLLYRFSPEWGASLSFATATHGRNIAGGFVFAGAVFYEF